MLNERKIFKSVDVYYSIKVQMKQNGDEYISQIMVKPLH